MRIVYLCTSNVCRSPLAEAIAKNYLQQNNIPESEVSVVSRGLTDRYSEWGSPCEPRMVNACRNKIGGSCPKLVCTFLEKHKAKPLAKEDSLLDENNIYFIVTNDHLTWARDYGLDSKLVFDKAVEEKRVRLVRVDGENVFDPFFGDEEYYDSCADMLLEVVPESLKNLLLEVKEKEKSKKGGV